MPTVLSRRTLTLVLIITLAFFILIAALVASKNPGLKQFDDAVQLSALTHQGALLFWSIITNFGGLAVLLLVVILGVVLLREDHPAQIAFVAASAIAPLLDIVLKAIFGVDRPDMTLAPYYAFPSGHALSSMTIYVLLAYLLLRKSRLSANVAAQKRKVGSQQASYQYSSFLFIPTIVCLCMLPILVGISRVMINVHWASDVIAGWTLGIALVAGCLLVAKLE